MNVITRYTALQREVQRLTRYHAEKGSKRNRRAQIRLMLAFAAFADQHLDAISRRDTGRTFENVGGHTLRAYWRHLDKRGLAPTTQRDHWYALVHLWRWAGMPGDPLKPHALVQLEKSRRDKP